MAVNPTGSTSIRMFFRLNDSTTSITASSSNIIGAGNANAGGYNTLAIVAKLNKGDKVYYLTNGDVQNSSGDSNVWGLYVFGYLVCPS